jgi:hypothetical protein
MYILKYMRSKISKGEINPKPLSRKSLFSSFLDYFQLIYEMVYGKFKIERGQPICFFTKKVKASQFSLVPKIAGFFPTNL